MELEPWMPEPLTHGAEQIPPYRRLLWLEPGPAEQGNQKG